MKNIKKITLTALSLLLAQVAPVAAESSCPRCDDIRAENAACHQNYEYYEDYLESQKNETPTKRVKGKLSDNSTRRNNIRKKKINNNASITSQTESTRTESSEN